MILRFFNLVLFLVVLSGGIYYTIVDKQAQGSLLVLMGILYFVALPNIRKS